MLHYTSRKKNHTPEEKIRSQIHASGATGARPLQWLTASSSFSLSVFRCLSILSLPGGVKN